MIKSSSFETSKLDELSFIDKLTIDNFSNYLYSNELIHIMNNKFSGNISDIYNLIKAEYDKKFNKKSSINSIVKCLSSYKYFTDKLMKERTIIENNKEQYFMTNWFIKAIDAINGIEEQNLFLFSNEFRRSIANKYFKLDVKKFIKK